MSDIFDEPDGLKQERREKLKQNHPDRGGDPEEFKKIIDEYDEKIKNVDNMKSDIEQEIKEVKSDEVKEIENNENDSFKSALEKLWNIEVTNNDESNPYVVIDVPDSVKLGDKLIIKLSKKVPNMQLGFGDDIIWTRETKYDPNSKMVVKLKPTILRDFHNKNFNDDVIEFTVGEVKKIAGKETQTWLSGDYLLEVRAFGKEWHEETSIRKMVKVLA